MAKVKHAHRIRTIADGLNQLIYIHLILLYLLDANLLIYLSRFFLQWVRLHNRLDTAHQIQLYYQIIQIAHAADCSH